MAKKTGIGIDFGTSNSAAAWFDGDQVKLIQLETDDAIMPTATHIDRDLQTIVGQQAVTQYIDENRDRIVELTPEIVAKAQVLTGEANAHDPSSEAEVSTMNTYGKPIVDRGLPGRLFRGIKRLLGNPSINRLMVFDQAFRVVALVTPVLVHIRRKIQDTLHVKTFQVHFGHPVNFEGHGDHSNELGKSRLTEALTYAGMKDVNFYPEPIAATMSYLQHEQPKTAGLALTLDFGGGTLDLSVVAYEGVKFEVLSTGGMSLGGDHIDQLIFRELLFPLFGKGEIWRRVVDGQVVENEFPFVEFEDKLLNWAVTYTLNQNHYRAKVADCIAQGGELGKKLQRLDELITHNYSYLVFQYIKEAKVALSEHEQTILDIPELDISVTFTRQQFESMMVNMLNDIDQIVDKVLLDANKTASEISVLIRTGGSSQIASVRDLMEAKFPGRVTEHDPFTSVATGLAIASYYGYQFE